MIEDSLFKTNFIGRDGFRWWIGQVAPVDAWKEQANGSGWGNRYKVRILGYHPYNEVELSNEDLPWAGTLLPVTAGSGAANYSQNPKIKQGDVVVGFFLDGDNAQLPMIMGTFGRTDQVPSNQFLSPFAPFTGYTNNIKNDGSNVVKSESNEDKTNSQKSPRALSQEQIDQLNQKKEEKKQEKDERTQSTAIGQKVIFADTCDDSFMGEVNGLLGNLLSVVGGATNFLSDVSSVVTKIQNLSNNLVGQLFNSLYNGFIPILSSGLELLYKQVYAQVYAKVFALTPGDFAIKNAAGIAAGHLAGVTAQKMLVIPIKELQDAMSCVASKVVNGLGDMVRDLIEKTILEVVNFGVCSAEQFASKLINNILDDISDGLGSIIGNTVGFNSAGISFNLSIGGLLSLANPGFAVADFLRSSVNNIQSIGGLFDCNQSNAKCKKLVKEWTIGCGAEGSFDLNKVYENVLENMNISSALAKNGQIIPVYGKPNCNVPTTCGSPTVTFFGGDGFNAKAKAILGNFVSNVEGLQDVTATLAQTASIIGVEIEDPGYGYYNAPPLVAFSDSCNLGYGAIGRAIVDYDKNSKTYGQVTGIYMISVGENYPVGNVDIQVGSDVSENLITTVPYGITGVFVVSQGSGYSTGDTATDNIGNTYSLTVDEGRIVSVSTPSITQVTQINSIKTTTLPEITINTSTGIGAILRPIIGRLPTTPQGKIESVIDCIT